MSYNKGWNRLLRSWLSQAASSGEKAVYRNELRSPSAGERLTFEEIVHLAKGVAPNGAWWGSKRGER